jgi:ABC-type Fe3+-hydroxamate transport system substrate-binding protein
LKPAPSSALIDAAGVAHAVAQNTRNARIVSLVPSITETLFALGLGARVVGRTGFCIHPRAAVASIPKVGGTKDVNLKKLCALAPTHVIVNIDENEKPTVDAIRDFVPHIVVTHPNAPEDNLALFRLLGGVFDAESAAAELCAQMQAELDACAARQRGYERWPPERVLYLIWKDPWMTVAADTYIARTLAQIGWQVPHPPGGWSGAARYPALALEDWVPQVDRVLLSSEPYAFNAADVQALRARFAGTPVDLIDGEMTSWYGVRAIGGLRYLRNFRSVRSG